MSIIDAIAIGCDCSKTEAQEYLNEEVNNLRELADNHDLSCEDIREACSNLGIDQDYEFHFITQLAVWKGSKKISMPSK